MHHRRVAHNLNLDLGEINSVNLIDIDNALETAQQSAGIKWTFFRSNLLNSDNRVSAASLEVSAYPNKSDDFNLVTDQIQLNNLEVNCRDPQTFSVADLEDEGWKARLIYSWPLSEIGIGSVWAEFGESEATSGTISDLTSGVRRIVKQMHLFPAEAIKTNGNLSRSLAPPGHSCHGIGDFDIGKIGYGAKNFTADFSRTTEYQKIARLGYVDIRYPTDNLFAVRFEPWHIKIA